MPKGLKVNMLRRYLHIHTYYSILTAKIWNQPQCPLLDPWIKKMWEMPTMEFYSEK